MTSFEMRRAASCARWICLVLVATFCAIPAAATYEIPLVEGWNLVSLPEQQTDTDVTAVTASIAGQLEAVWAWRDGEWRFYSPVLPSLSNLETMDAGRAYWLLMNAPTTLVGHGLRPASSVDLQPGWNFIGFNGNVAQSFDSLLSPGPCVQRIWSWVDGSWRFFEPANPLLGDLTTATPGQGYWLLLVRLVASRSISTSLPRPRPSARSKRQHSSMSHRPA